MDEHERRELERWRGIVERAIPPENLDAQVALGGIFGFIEERDEKSVTDYLTGLPNRLALEERDRTHQGRPNLLHRIHEPRATFALYPDLDRFKPVNDTLGHHRGDRVLQIVSHALRHSVREEDEIFRVGGDEFFIYGRVYDDTEVETLPQAIQDRFFSNLNWIIEEHPEAEGILPEGFGLDRIDKEALKKVGATFGVHIGEPYATRGELLNIAEADMRALKRGREEDR